MIKVRVMLENGVVDDIDYNDESFDEIYNEYQILLDSNAPFIAIGTENNQTIINRNKILYIHIREANAALGESEE